MNRAPEGKAFTKQLYQDITSILLHESYQHIIIILFHYSIFCLCICLCFFLDKNVFKKIEFLRISQYSYSQIIVGRLLTG
jgi:hypothetical protein